MADNYTVNVNMTVYSAKPDHPGHLETIQFTNLNMNTVKAAIDYLNGDTAPTSTHREDGDFLPYQDTDSHTTDADMIIAALRFYIEHPEYNDDTERAADALTHFKERIPAQELDRDTLNGWRRTAPYPVEESKGDFTVTELFPPGPDGFTSDWCQECGVKVPGRLQRKHTGWHNKLLP